ncbi:MAG: phosphatase PAP2 family protein [Chitinophagaceae bacterium]|nr:phosphatase PAP2 family protein [Chitinophagaceae bacterium]
MKKIFWVFCSITTMSLLLSCSKTVNDRTADTGPLLPADADADAGTWKTILLNAPDEIALNAPAPNTTPDYRAEINEIKGWQANLSAADKKIVAYWSAGAVLRWNEIMRELVAKHNLPPYQNEDGTYPVPSAVNPLAYPQFPFANPPYAARAYAYISGAQYDALVAAWHYKQLYGRKAPYTVDSSLQVFGQKTLLPSYPSTEGVIIGAAVEMFKLMFPGDQDYIQQKAEEHKRAAIISGANVRSDVDAGIALGKAVAQKFVSRARVDGTGSAGGNATIWSGLETSTVDKGEMPWYSLELPKRPPMLPLFGKVKPFLFDSATVVALRPGPPPSAYSDVMKKDAEEVLNIVKNASREQLAIVHLWADGAGTVTPPGHWNTIAAEDFIKKNYSEVRWARNMALLNMTMMDAAIVCWETKYYYFNPRPTQMNPAIKTLTGIPNFPAYISGHATFSSAAAVILGHMLPEREQAYEKMAKEASMSRLYGGIHYRTDCEAGYETGAKIGLKAVARAVTDGAE